MTEPYADIARRAAEKLARQVGAGLPAHVEACLAAAEDSAPARYVDPGTIAAFAGVLVSAATLAWTIVKDLRDRKAPPPAPEPLARELRLKIELPAGVTTQQRDQAIRVVVEEVLGDGTR